MFYLKALNKIRHHYLYGAAALCTAAFSYDDIVGLFCLVSCFGMAFSVLQPSLVINKEVDIEIPIDYDKKVAFYSKKDKSWYTGFINKKNNEILIDDSAWPFLPFIEPMWYDWIYANYEVIDDAVIIKKIEDRLNEEVKS